MRQPFAYKTQPREKQREALRKSAKAPFFALLMDPGTGKTKVTLDTAAYLWGQDQIDNLIVVAPNGLHDDVWVTKEAPKHLGVPYAAEAFYSGRSLRRFDALMARDPAEGLRLFTINIEALSSKTGQAVVDQWMASGRTMLAVDESQMIKTPSAARTRHLWKLATKAAYRRILTGSVATKGLVDLYAQFRFLHPDIIGCRTFTEFKTQYCVIVSPNGTFQKIVGYQNEQQLFARIAPFMFSVRLEDCVDMPDRTFQQRPVALTEDQHRIFTDLRDTFAAEVRAGVNIEATHQLARLTKLQQIVAGHFVRDDGAVELLNVKPRVDAVVRIAEQVPKKFIVWCAWRPEVETLRSALENAGIPVARYYGDLTQAQNQAEADRFQNDPTCRGIIATPAKAARGHTWNEATVVVYYSYGFNYEHRIQSLARNYRDGQHEPVVVYDLVAPGTTDPYVLRNLDSKEEMAETLRDPERFLAVLEGRTAETAKSSAGA